MIRERIRKIGESVPAITTPPPFTTLRTSLAHRPPDVHEPIEVSPAECSSPAAPSHAPRLRETSCGICTSSMRDGSRASISGNVPAVMPIVGVIVIFDAVSRSTTS